MFVTKDGKIQSDLPQDTYKIKAKKKKPKTIEFHSAILRALLGEKRLPLMRSLINGKAI